MESAGVCPGPVLFNIFSNDLEQATQYTLKFANGSRPGGPVDMLEGRAANQGYLGRLEGWACRNLTKLSKDKCQVLHLRERRAPDRDTGWGQRGCREQLYMKSRRGAGRQPGAKRGCAISILGGFQDWTKQTTEQPSLTS